MYVVKGLSEPATEVGIKHNAHTLKVTFFHSRHVLSFLYGRTLLLTDYALDAAVGLNVCFQASVRVCSASGADSKAAYTVYVTARRRQFKAG